MSLRKVKHEVIQLSPNKPESSGASLGRHEDGLGDVVQDLEQKLGVGASLGGRLDLVRVQLAGLSGFDDSGQRKISYS